MLEDKRYNVLYSYDCGMLKCFLLFKREFVYLDLQEIINCGL